MWTNVGHMLIPFSSSLLRQEIVKDINNLQIVNLIILLQFNRMHKVFKVISIAWSSESQILIKLKIN